MKILCLLSWKPGSRWLWDYLPDSRDLVDFASVSPLSDRFPGYGKLFEYYPKYLRLGQRAFARMQDYDLIVTWEANTALPLAFMRSLTGRRTPPLVVLNFVLKGQPVLDLLPLVRFAMRSVDRITCLSLREIEYYSQVLSYPVGNCQKLQGPFRDFFADSHRYQFGGSNPIQGMTPYIFSAGRSHRDYQTLVEAVRDIPIRVIINARQFNVKGIQPPANVTINPFLPFGEYLDMLEKASFVVAPLLTARHASGETFIIQAMTTRKAVIASQTYSTAEIIENGVNGLLVPPGDPQALRAAIQQLIQDPGLAYRLGQTARQHYLERWSFPIVSRQIDQLLQSVTSQRTILN